MGQEVKSQQLAIVGLGYVGLPLAVAFSRVMEKPVIGFDVNVEKISQLKGGIDPTREVGDVALASAKLLFSADPATLQSADYIIAAVPTPIHPDKTPDLSLVQSATQTIAQNLKQGATIIFESTVYPGVTEEICIPILEKGSGLKAGVDFFVGYSPERVNPGDTTHGLGQVIKIVSGQDEQTIQKISALYELVCLAGVHKAPNIKTAEAAKVIENIQRDLNIALVNELALIFQKLGIDTNAVLAAAGTKWNFHNYHPGLVGGHCIGVDPYYLTHKAQSIGYEPKVILAGRALNDAMPEIVAGMIFEALQNKTNPRIAVFGITFKQNVNDVRNSKALEVVAALEKRGATVFTIDPLVDKVKNQTSSFEEIANIDAAVFLVPHDAFGDILLETLLGKMTAEPVLFDLWQLFDKDKAQKLGFTYLTL